MSISATRTPAGTGRIALIAAVLFVITYIGALIAARMTLSTGAKAGISVFAVAAFAGFIVAELQLIRRLDELQRRIQLEALAFAFPVSIGFLMLLGLFQQFMILPPDDLSYRHVWPPMALAYVAGLALARWRYR